jgi:hypothetical protein
MISVATYSIYLLPNATQGGSPQPTGDVGGGTIAVNQPGPAVIDITAVGGLVFADPALTWLPAGSAPSWCAWGPVVKPPPEVGPLGEIAVLDANGAAGQVSFALNLVGVDQPLTLTIVNSID